MNDPLGGEDSVFSTGNAASILKRTKANIPALSLKKKLEWDKKVPKNDVLNLDQRCLNCSDDV